MITIQNFLSFFKGLFNQLMKYGDAASYKKAARTMSAAARIANQKYKNALQANPPTSTSGFQSATSASSLPPRQPGSPSSGGIIPPTPNYEDGIDFRVSSSWVAGLNFRPLHAGKGGIVQHYTGPRIPTTLPDNKGDLTLITIRPSYANPTGRYIYPNVPRTLMDQAVRASSPGRFYHRSLKHYSNRSLIGRRMRRTGRRLKY